MTIHGKIINNTNVNVNLKSHILLVAPCLMHKSVHSTRATKQGYFSLGQARPARGAHILSVKEDDNMPKSVPVVRCVFAPAGSALSELLEESFRLYLRRILAGSCTQR